MILDLYKADEDPAAVPTEKFVPEPGAGFGEAASIALESALRYRAVTANAGNTIRSYWNLADDFYKISGQRVGNPVAPTPTLRGDPEKMAPYRGRGGSFRKAVDEWNQANPDKLFIMPSDGDVERMGQEIARKAFAKERGLDERPGSFGASAGALAGGMLGAAVDLPNLVTMPFGGGTTLARTFIREAAIGTAASGASEVGSFGYKKTINPQHSVGDAVADTLFGGVSQGALAAGLQGGVRGLAWLYNRGRNKADPMAAAAGNTTMADAHTDVRVPQAADSDLHATTVAAMNKAYDDYRGGTPMRDDVDLLARAGDRHATVYDNQNTPVQVRYEVVEARDLITSHLDDFRENPDFPSQFQPRDRARGFSQTQVTDIASRLVPERLGPSMDASTGTPIVGLDNLVESGNGRVMALRKVFEGGTVAADRYKGWLAKQGYNIEGIENPVLIGRRVSAMDDAARMNFVRAAQDSGTMQMSASEKARSDAGKMDDAMLAIYAPGRVTSAKNRDFVREFAKTMSKGEQAGLFDSKGQLSVEGAKRIEAALAARAYEDQAFLARVLEDTDNNIKSIGGAMMDAAGPWARLRAAVLAGKVPAHIDPTNDLMDALRMVIRARDEGRPISEMLAQGDLLFEAGPHTLSILKAMFRDGTLKTQISRSKLAALLEDIATESRKVDAAPTLLGDPLSKGDILEGALTRAERQDILASALEPAEIRAKLDTPEGQDAVVQQAYRDAAGKEVMIEHEGQMRPASEVLMELDEMAAAAKELHACAVGREAAE